MKLIQAEVSDEQWRSLKHYLVNQDKTVKAAVVEWIEKLDMPAVDSHSGKGAVVISQKVPVPAKPVVRTLIPGGETKKCVKCHQPMPASDKYFWCEKCRK